MMSTRSSYCTAQRRSLKEGNVLICDHKQKNPLRRYLLAKCGGSEPAKLELYLDGSCEHFMREISFRNVANLTFKGDDNMHITITKKDRSDITFYAYSDEATKEWIQYCMMLFTIPKYRIAEFPKEMYVTEELISHYSDPQRFRADRVWVVYILHEGIGEVINVTGLHILALDYNDRMLKLYGFQTGKCILTWNGPFIRRCGYIKSLVFVEAGKKCHGGEGLLWMQHPTPYSTELCECLYRFLKLELTVAPSCCTHTDSVEQPQHAVTRATAQSQKHHLGAYRGSGMRNPDQDHYKQIDSPLHYHSQSTYPNHTCNRPISCSSDGGTPTIGQPHSTSTLSFDVPTQTKDEPLFKGHSPTTALGYKTRSHSIPPPLPPKHDYQNVAKVRRRIASDSQSNNGGHQSNLPPQSATMHGTKAKDQRSSRPSTSPRLLSQFNLEKKALQGCSVTMTEKLDVSTILPHLNEQGMLNLKDYQTLINKHITEIEKIEYLIYILPRKTDFFGKLIFCLCKSKYGTGHDDIIQALTKLKAKFEEDNKNACNGKTKSYDRQQDEDDEDGPYPIFIDLPGGIRSVKVTSSQTISSLMIELSSKLNIRNPLEIQVDGDTTRVYKPDHKDTMRTSKIHRHSFISVLEAEPEQNS